MDLAIHPCQVSRSFTAAGLVANLNCVTARPGYSLAYGGPTLTSGAAHETGDTREIKPTIVRWITTGAIVLRYYLGHDSSGNLMYYDDTAQGLAGESAALRPDVIVDVGTTADFALGWP